MGTGSEIGGDWCRTCSGHTSNGGCVCVKPEQPRFCEQCSGGPTNGGCSCKPLPHPQDSIGSDKLHSPVDAILASMASFVNNAKASGAGPSGIERQKASREHFGACVQVLQRARLTGTELRRVTSALAGWDKAQVFDPVGSLHAAIGAIRANHTPKVSCEGCGQIHTSGVCSDNG